MPARRQQMEYDPRAEESSRYEDDDRFDFERRRGRWARLAGEGQYAREPFAQGANYGQDYAMQGGRYGGQRSGSGAWPQERPGEYGGPDWYGDRWRGREQGFRGSDRGGMQWRQPDYGPRGEYGGPAAPRRSRQDDDWQWNEGRYGGSPQSWGGDPYGSERFGPDYDRRYWGDEDRYYGRGGYGGKRGSSSAMGERPFGQGARMAYDEDYYEARGSAGPFSGRGPKGYRRSDDAIRDDACEVLTRFGGVDASDIVVSVKDGVITLSGTVDDRRQKRAAEYAIDDISGVTDVSNQLRVAGMGSPSKPPETPRSAPGSVENGKLSPAGRKA